MPPPYKDINDFLLHGLEVSECPICREEYVATSSDPPTPPSSPTNAQLVRIRSCGHQFHRGCLTTWMNAGHGNTCPTCRAVLF